MSPGSTRRVDRLGPAGTWRIAVPVATIAAGVLFVASALSADGTDLRSATTDLRTLVVDRGSDVDAARAQERRLRTEVETLTADLDNTAVDQARREVRGMRPSAGLSEVRGQGIRITLTDAPADVIKSSGLDPNLLVVHQQDIQAFVNAVWAAGAEAVSLQGERLISTTGIKCVGNTVLLHGVPYSPPYVIEAVGDPGAMYAVLDDFDKISVYREYVEVYQLGLEIELPDTELTIPAYDGAPQLEHAIAVTG
jgi:uncharacterized protein YlxW (UPF0749 family)